MVHKLRDPDLVESFDLSRFASIDTLLDCGPFNIAVYMADQFRSPIDEKLFAKRDLWAPEMKEFAVLRTENWDAVGEYSFSYTIYLDEYPDRKIEILNAFTVSIVNPCESIISQPAWCPVNYVDPGLEIVVLPQWMLDLKDQTVTLGENDLNYRMGEPLNAYGNPMEIEV